MGEVRGQVERAEKTRDGSADGQDEADVHSGHPDWSVVFGAEGIPVSARGRIVAVDEQVWEALWAHRDPLVAMARRHVGCEEDARDIVEEALVRAVSADGLNLDSAGAWLNRVVRNLCIDHLRERGYNQHRLSYQLRVQIAEPSVEDLVCTRDLVRRVLDAITTLPERQRAAMLLSIAGMTARQIGLQVGCTAKGAERRLENGRARLRQVTKALLPPLVIRRHHKGAWLSLVAVASPLMVAAVLIVPLPTFSAAPSLIGSGGIARAPLTTAAQRGSERAKRRVDLGASTAIGVQGRWGSLSPSPETTVVAPRSARVGDYASVRTGKVTHSGKPSDIPAGILACIRGGIEVSPSYLGCKGSAD